MRPPHCRIWTWGILSPHVIPKISWRHLMLKLPVFSKGTVECVNFIAVLWGGCADCLVDCNCCLQLEISVKKTAIKPPKCNCSLVNVVLDFITNVAGGRDNWSLDMLYLTTSIHFIYTVQWENETVAIPLLVEHFILACFGRQAKAFIGMMVDNEHLLEKLQVLPMGLVMTCMNH